MKLINILFGEQLSRNFHSSEVVQASHTSTATFPIDMDLIHISQYVRDRLGVPVNINSAYRERAYNETLPGSAKNSQHIEGRAFDLSGEGVVEFFETAYQEKNSDWYRLIDLGLNGLGFYDTFIHIDTRPGSFATWNKKKTNEGSDKGVLYILIAILISVAIFFKKIIG